MTVNFSKIKDSCQTGYILRKNIGRATDGMLNPRTMANLDVKNEGIKNRIKINNKVAYNVDYVIEYLQKKVTIEKKT